MSNIAILISSFDKYSACWDPFCHGLKKYWQQHFEPVYIITNQKESPCGQAIKVGTDKGWAGNLILALKKIPQEYILYSQEDYWINRPVDHAEINTYLDFLRTDQADYIRLYPAPPPSLPFSRDSRLGILEKHAEYRTSLQMALWRKSTLLDLLAPKETPWQFEAQGSRRSQVYGDRFLSVQKKAYGIQYVFTAIVDGEWSPAAREYALKEEILVSFESLPKKPPLKKLIASSRSYLYKIRRRFRV